MPRWPVLCLRGVDPAGGTGRDRCTAPRAMPPAPVTGQLGPLVRELRYRRRRKAGGRGGAARWQLHGLLAEKARQTHDATTANTAAAA